MSEESGWKIGSTFSKATIYKTTVIVREEDDIIVAFAQNDEAARKIVAVPEMIKALDIFIDVIENISGQYTEHDALLIADEARIILAKARGEG